MKQVTVIYFSLLLTLLLTLCSCNKGPKTPKQLPDLPQSLETPPHAYLPAEINTIEQAEDFD